MEIRLDTVEIGITICGFSIKGRAENDRAAGWILYILKWLPLIFLGKTPDPSKPGYVFADQVNPQKPTVNFTVPGLVGVRTEMKPGCEVLFTHFEGMGTIKRGFSGPNGRAYLETKSPTHLIIEDALPPQVDEVSCESGFQTQISVRIQLPNQQTVVILVNVTAEEMNAGEQRPVSKVGIFLPPESPTTGSVNPPTGAKPFPDIGSPPQPSSAPVEFQPHEGPSGLHLEEPPPAITNQGRPSGQSTAVRQTAPGTPAAGKGPGK